MTKHNPTDTPQRPSSKQPQTQTPETAPPQSEPPAQDPTAQLRAELDAAKDRVLRSHAELENYRKRASRELEDRLRYANIGLLRDLLPVLDNVERAIAAAAKHTVEDVAAAERSAPEDGQEPTAQSSAHALLEGFGMVERQLEDVLRRHHCQRIDALHKPFDPNLHHAVMQQPSDEYPENTVLIVTQQGYQLHDRVVRPSQVIVSKTP
ncbi:MAG: nucleotide exchange factor GrpE [Thermoguttaceae bacterium]